MPRFPTHLPDIHVPEIQPENISVDTHQTGREQTSHPNLASDAVPAQPFVGRRDRVTTRFEPYARPSARGGAPSEGMASVAPPQGAASLLRSAHAQLTQSLERGRQHEDALRGGQYWAHVYARIWDDHVHSCMRELARSEAQLAEQQVAASEGNEFAASNVRIVASGLPQLREELTRAQDALGRLTRHPETLMPRMLRNQQDMYRWLIQRNGINEQLQSLERGGSPPQAGGEAASDSAASDSGPRAPS